MSNKKEISKKLFDQTNLPKDAMNWHVWKRAFDLGYDIGINEVTSSRMMCSFPTTEDLYKRAKLAADGMAHATDYANGYEAGYQACADYIEEQKEDYT